MISHSTKFSWIRISSSHLKNSFHFIGKIFSSCAYHRSDVTFLKKQISPPSQSVMCFTVRKTSYLFHGFPTAIVSLNGFHSWRIFWTCKDLRTCWHCFASFMHLKYFFEILNDLPFSFYKLDGIESKGQTQETWFFRYFYFFLLSFISNETFVEFRGKQYLETRRAAGRQAGYIETTCSGVSLWEGHWTKKFYLNGWTFLGNEKLLIWKKSSTYAWARMWNSFR